MESNPGVLADESIEAALLLQRDRREQVPSAALAVGRRRTTGWTHRPSPMGRL
jgi:hypothetical protein